MSPTEWDPVALVARLDQVEASCRDLAQRQRRRNSVRALSLGDLSGVSTNTAGSPLCREGGRLAKEVLHYSGQFRDFIREICEVFAQRLDLRARFSSHHAPPFTRSGCGDNTCGCEGVPVSPARRRRGWR